MHFSIRDMFLATFLVALGLLAWMTGVAINRQQVDLSEAKNQLAAEEADARQLVNQQQYHQASIDRFALVAAVGQQADSAFPALQERYAEIRPANEQTVSIRTVPMRTESETGIRLNRTRVYVPEQREVYLILRTIRAKGFPGSSHNPDDPPPPIDKRFVTNGGPFQVRLIPGLHDIDWVTSAKQVGKPMTLDVYLDHQLLSTSSWSIDSGGMSHQTSFFDQTDFALTQPLPVLTDILVAADAPTAAFGECYLQLILGDKQSDYRDFPPFEKRDNQP